MSDDTKAVLTDSIVRKSQKFLENGWTVSAVASLYNVRQSELRKKLKLKKEFYSSHKSAREKRCGEINHCRFIPVKVELQKEEKNNVL